MRPPQQAPAADPTHHTGMPHRRFHWAVTALLVGALLAPTSAVAQPFTGSSSVVKRPVSTIGTHTIHDADILWDTRYIVGAVSSLEVSLWAATALSERAPTTGKVTVTLSQIPPKVVKLTRAQKRKAKRAARKGKKVKAKKPIKRWSLWTGDVSASGRVVPTFRVPAISPGRYNIIITSISPHGRNVLTHRVEVERRTKVLVRTDRPIYKPGQAIRWRATLANGANGRPHSRAKVAVAITDPRGTQIWRGDERTDQLGMLSGKLPLAAELLHGKYTVSVSYRGERGSQTVSVRRFELPPFFVDVHVSKDRYPLGGHVVGHVQARYPYGEPVDGTINVKARADGRVIWRTRGKLDDGGLLPIDFRLPKLGDGKFTIEATVADGAGRERLAETSRPWGVSPVQVLAVTQSPRLAPGVEQVVTLLTLDRAGQTVPATLSISAPSAGVDVTGLRSNGVVPFKIKVPAFRTTTTTSVRAELNALDMSPSDDARLEATKLIIDRNAPALWACLSRDNAVSGANSVASVSMTATFRRHRLIGMTAEVQPFASREDFRVPASSSAVICARRILAGEIMSVAAVLPAGAAPDTSVKLSLGLIEKRGTRESKQAVRRIPITIVADFADGRQARHEKTLVISHDRGTAAALTLPRQLIEQGSAIEAVATWPDTGHVVTATLVRGDVAVATAQAVRKADGKLHASLTPAPGMFGLASVRFTEAHWHSHAASVRTTTRAANVYIKPARLDIDASIAKRVKPGEVAKLKVTVRDAAGKPVAGAGLAASVVDKRVLALGKPQVDLVSAFIGPDLERAKYAGLAFRHHALKASPTDVDRLLSRTILNTLALSPATPNVQRPAAARWLRETRRVDRAYLGVLDVLVHRGGGVVDRSGTSPRITAGFAEALAEVKTSKKKKAVPPLTPWGKRTDWSYVRTLRSSTTPSAVGVAVSQGRVHLLGRFLKRRKAKAKSFFRGRRAKDSLVAFLAKARGNQALAVDGWGTEIKVRAGIRRVGMDVVSAGLDGLFGTGDDIVAHDVLAESGGGGLGFAGSGMGGGGSARSFRGQGVSGRSRVGPLGALAVAIRKRFDATVLWSVGEQTNAAGQVEFSVPMADSITGWEVEIEGIAANGAFGRTVVETQTFLERSMSVHVPSGLSEGDTYKTRVVVANHSRSDETYRLTASPRGGLTSAWSSQTASKSPQQVAQLVVKAGTTAALPLTLKSSEAGKGTLKLTLAVSRGGGYTDIDAVERSVAMTGLGALERRVYNHRLVDGRADFPVSVPADALASSVDGRIRVFRGSSDIVLDGLEGMLKEPYGCFEQTSSSTYPNLLVLRLLKGVPGMGGVREKARGMVARGYQRLVSYEVRSGGFSWFGRGSAQTTLTAYGLLEFQDMSAVYPVDPALLRRTRRWLSKRQKANGTWASSGGASTFATTAYIAWALAESGSRKAADRALRWLRKNAKSNLDDAYGLALWANVERARGGDGTAAWGALKRHIVMAPKGGSMLEPAPNRYRGSVFYGRGSTLRIEQTALLAMTKAPKSASTKFEPSEAMTWLWRHRHPRYGWGSTQATVLALRAASVVNPAPPIRTGSVTVQQGPGDDAKTVAKLPLSRAMLPTASVALSPGKSTTVGLRGAATLAGLRGEMRVSWRTATAAKANSQGLQVHLDAPKTKVRVGESLGLSVGVFNTASANMDMPTIEVPIPPGFKVVTSSLQAHVNARRISRFEVRSGRLNLYLTKLRAKRAVVIPFQLESVAQCDVRQRGAEAFAYYQPELRGRSDGLRLQVVE